MSNNGPLQPGKSWALSGRWGRSSQLGGEHQQSPSRLVMTLLLLL